MFAGIASAQAPANAFDAYLSNPFPPADGFDLPVGDGSGDANGDLGQPVHATAAGRVVDARDFEQPWGGVIVLEHVYYENHARKSVRSVYAHLSRIDVTAGAVVTRRQIIGAIGQDPEKKYSAHLHFELRTNALLDATYWPSTHGETLKQIESSYLRPSEFIARRRSLPVPGNEEALVLIQQATNRMRLYRHGVQTAELEVAFGQGEGEKQRRGDLKTPAGMYFVVSKSTGPFEGDYASFYGGYWIKVNYPNAYDAERGLEQKLITRKERDEIIRTFWKRELTPQKTKLGGGIGFHGWASEWTLDGGSRLSWGCVVLHSDDIARVFEQIPLGAMVVLL